MARGTPDDRIVETFLAGQISDVSYVANMLWGFAPIDSQGRVIFFDTFNNGLGAWDTRVSGVGVLPKIVTGANVSMIFSPPNAVQMDPSATVGGESFAIRKQYMGKTTRLGAEAVVELNNTVGSYQMMMDYNPIGYPAKLGSIRFDHAAGAWQVFDGNLSWQTFYNAGVPPASTRMHVQVKFVCDFATAKYVRAYIGDQFFDLSQYVLGGSVVTTNYDGYLYSDMRNYSYGAGTTPGVYGYYLLTKDEP